MSAPRYRQPRSVPAQAGMADLIDMAVKVMRTRARRLLLAFTGRRTGPVFELLIVNDELADLAANLSDRSLQRDATGREIDR